MKQNTKTKEMFIIRALEKILKDKDVRRKDNIELKKACEAALGKSRKYRGVGRDCWSYLTFLNILQNKSRLGSTVR